MSHLLSYIRSRVPNALNMPKRRCEEILPPKFTISRPIAVPNQCKCAPESMLRMRRRTSCFSAAIPKRHPDFHNRAPKYAVLCNKQRHQTKFPVLKCVTPVPILAPNSDTIQLQFRARLMLPAEGLVSVAQAKERSNIPIN